MTKSNNKKKLFEKIKNTVITILVVIIILLSKCNGEGNLNIQNNPKVITETETIIDTVTIVKNTYIPKWETKIIRDTIEIEKVLEVDTLLILREYFDKYVYLDTIKIDTIGFMTIEDTIYQNRVLYRKPMVNITIPTQTITLLQNNNEIEYYAGLGVRTTMDKYTWMGLEGAIKTKKGNLFLLGLGTDNQNKFSVGGSVHWKLINK